MTDTAAEAPPKPELTPEQTAERKLNRAIARALARIDGPTNAGELKKRWTDERSKYLTQGKKLAKALAREGVTLAHEEKSKETEEAAGAEA